MEVAYKMDNRRYWADHTRLALTCRTCVIFLAYFRRIEAKASRARGVSCARGEERDSRVALALLSPLFAENTQKYSCSADYIYSTSVLCIKKTVTDSVCSVHLYVYNDLNGCS